MSDDLSRRIAVEVFGEPEPQAVTDGLEMRHVALRGWNWQKYMVYTDEALFKPHPKPFSANYLLALDAADYYFEHHHPTYPLYYDHIFIQYRRTHGFSASIISGPAGGHSTGIHLATCICECLLQCMDNLKLVNGYVTGAAFQHPYLPGGALGEV